MASNKRPIATEKSFFFLITLAVIAILQVGSWQIQRKFSSVVYEEVAHNQKRALDAAEHSLTRWLDDQSAGVRYWARQRLVVEATEELESLAGKPEKLLNAPAQQRLRERFAPLLKEMGYRGYFIVDPTLHNLASSRDSTIGVTSLLQEQPQFFARMRDGDVAMSLPLYSDSPLDEATDGQSHQRSITMFVGAPIRKQHGSLMGYFLFRLSVPKDFVQRFSALKFGRSGEVYGFDRSGRLLSVSRFEDELRKKGRLGAGESSQLKPLLRDAKRGSLVGVAATLDGDNSDNTLRYFKDYRGIDSIGMGRWLKRLNIGIAVKMDREEATASLKAGRHLMNGMTWGGSLLLLLFAAVLYVTRVRNWRMQGDLTAILQNSGEGIVSVNKQAIIETMNPVAAAMFGYEPEELIGKNINVLMPPELRAQHDQYVRDSNLYESRVINRSRDLFGLHKEGHLVPIELNVTRMNTGKEDKFIGLLHNISERLEVQRALKESEELLQRSQQVAHVGSWEWEVQSDELKWSDETYRLFDLDKESDKVCYENYLSRVHPEDRARLEKAIDAALKGEIDPFDAEHRVLTRSGEVRFLRAIGKVFRDTAGEAVRMTGSIQDVTERHLLEQELEEYRADLEETVEKRTAELRLANQRITLATDSAAIGIWDLNLIDNSLLWDEWMYRLYGVSPGMFSGAYEAWEQGVHPDDRGSASTELEQAIKGEKAFATEFRIIWPDGAVRWIKADGTLIRDGKGNPVRMIGTNQDISDRKFVAERLEAEVKQRTAELERAKQQAEEAVEAKSAFLATMSHEIRTPMNGVVGMIELLRNTPLNDEQRRMIGVVHDSSYSLLRIIDDILDLSKIEAGKLELERVEFNLSDVLDSVADIMRPVAQSKRVRFYLYDDPKLPQQVLGDPIRVRQILYNLCGNAIKFTNPEKGIVALEARLQKADEAAKLRVWVHFSVEDNGIGMSEAVTTRLFSPFYQAEASTTRRFGGTGLGLSICKKLTDMMGGSITVESTPHRGSTFSVELPFEIAAVGENSVVEPDISDLSVLCFISDERELDNLNGYIRACGCNSRVVTTEQELYEVLQSSYRCDIVLLYQDFASPPPLAVLDELRERCGSSVRFVIAVPEADSLSQLQAEDSILVENYPLKRRALYYAIASAVGRASPPIKTSEELITVDVSPPTRELARDMKRLILVVEDNTTNQEVILRQLWLLGYAADMADNGLEALRMWRTEEYALVLTDCHMPVMDGYQLTAAIREEEAVQERTHTPIVAVTANALQGEGEKCLQCGMDGYLSKPLELKRLKQELHKWVEPVGAVQEKNSSAVEAGRDDEALINLDVLAEYVGDDRKVQHAIVHKFLDSVRNTLDELEQAIAQEQFDKVGELAHRIKSSARAMGAKRLTTIFLALEQAGKEGKRDVIIANQRQLKPLLGRLEKEVASLP